MGIMFVVGVGIALIIVRDPTEPLTRESLQAARERWSLAGIDDYRMRYRMHGSVYDVTVRDAIVTDVLVNGQTPQSADYGAYGVKGLFGILAEELENLGSEKGRLMGGGSHVVMRVRFNPKFGYIERYLRSSSAVGRGVSIELLEFTTPE